jgi:hypothetical protein
VAANLSVEIGITGNAQSAAQQLTTAFKELGAAGDQAAQKVSQLQQVAARPVGTTGGQAQITAQLVAGLERARQVYSQMMEEAKGMVDIGLGNQFQAVASSAGVTREAVATALTIFKDMIGEGRSVQEIFAAMREQVLGLPNAFEKMSGTERLAFRQMQEDIEGSITKYKAFQNVENQLVRDVREAGKQTSAITRRVPDLYCLAGLRTQ